MDSDVLSLFPLLAALLSIPYLVESASAFGRITNTLHVLPWPGTRSDVVLRRSPPAGWNLRRDVPGFPRELRGCDGIYPSVLYAACVDAADRANPGVRPGPKLGIMRCKSSRLRGRSRAGGTRRATLAKIS